MAGPLAIDGWIRGLDRIFKHLSCIDAQKVLCAKFMLVDATSHWWESASRTRTETQQSNLTWARFKEEVMEKYFPQALRDHKETEFLQLKQGKMALINLRESLNNFLEIDQKLIRQCEKALNFQERGNGMGRTRIKEMDKTRGLVLKGGQSQASRIMFLLSVKCNKTHRGKCWYGKNVCYRCGKHGHIATNCHEPPPKRENKQSKKGAAKVFALTQKEETEN
ncbi:uncharacterized protein LOC111371014 [Olea europaea var. sylvestris]|uniref:uncharacterized protein LOC111371014 n=1 Tax=Olea europaea var. sylvestris TaxID=158386 RepID=UPI000C1D6EC8|nr:uncharacterized protein LOC111371014 [Olea europaea var. sylvestris]